MILLMLGGFALFIVAAIVLIYLAVSRQYLE